MSVYTIPAMSTDVGREALISKIAALLKDYMKDGRTRTDLLKEAAPLILALRESHTLSDGRADISEVYRLAGVSRDPEILDTVQTALRYHLSNLIHEVVPQDEIEAAGMSRSSHKDRLDASRRATITAPTDVADALTRAQVMMAQGHSCLPS